jgi:hypothetical protein
VAPKDPLYKFSDTVSQLFDAFRVTLHVELGNDNVSQLSEDVLEVSGLDGGLNTMVSQTSSSRVSEWALTYACISFQIIIRW